MKTKGRHTKVTAFKETVLHVSANEQYITGETGYPEGAQTPVYVVVVSGLCHFHEVPLESCIVHVKGPVHFTPPVYYEIRTST